MPQTAYPRRAKAPPAQSKKLCRGCFVRTELQRGSAKLCTPLYSYAKLKGLEPIPNGLALSKFSDCGSISDWASDAVSWAAGVNYFGTDRRVRLMRFLQ